MYAFEYIRPASVRAAAKAIEAKPDAKLLAGGQTLLPTMKQRLASPDAVIDISRIPDLAGIEHKGRSLVIGAMTRHAEVNASDVVKAALPSLAALAGGIGDPAVRNRGTLGGSVANNDPSADYPAAVLGLDAVVHTNKRKIAADDFFAGMFSTALEEGEIITKIAFPTSGRSAYAKFRNPASRYAMVGVFVSKRSGAVRVAVTGAGSNGVFRWTDAEKALEARFSAKSLDGVALSPAVLISDIHGSADYRAHLVGVMARRAVDMA
jgi:carbon-monoxide dehydrogenase medium subunit